MLEVHELVKTYRSGDTLVTATDAISFQVPAGKFAAIVGKSGSGKSTLLSLLGALEKPTSGRIVVNGQNLAALRSRDLTAYRNRTIGFVFQSYNLIPTLTALENTMLPMEFCGVAKAQRLERAETLLKEVGLEADQINRRPGRLSGGQQQRVAIARALANQPQLILADEPTGNLDSQTGKIIFDLLHQLAKNQKTTVIVVTHDMDIAGQADIIFHLEDGKLKK